MRQQTPHEKQRDVVLFSEEQAVLGKFDFDRDIYIPSEADLIQYIEAEQKPIVKTGGGKLRPETALLSM